MLRTGTGLLVWFLCASVYAESSSDEFKIKREPPFEFAAKPTVTRNGDQIVISFTTKSLCDVSIAIEDDQGRIIRHLACGVLGEKAPPPFKSGSLEQSILWDGKNDQNQYVDNKDQLSVRVWLLECPNGL